MRSRVIPNRRRLDGVAVFGLEQAGEYLSANRNEVRRLCRSGELEAWTTAGGHWRISRTACDRWVAAQEARARAGREPAENR